MQRCSRYEWFLFDEIERILELTGREYLLSQQYPIKDHRGFYWYFDIHAWVKGKSTFGGVHLLIEVNGKDHDLQKEYSGPGGGYTKDFDKHWEVFSNHRLHKQGYEYCVVRNQECTRRGDRVRDTGFSIVAELLSLADTLC